MFYPLHAFVCERCYLVQLDKLAGPDELFRDYRYFSSYSTTWLAHATSYADEMTRRGIGTRSRVVEVASNDGYLLRNFVARGVPVLGIEPASNVAAVAREAGVPTLNEFFGTALAHRVRAEFGDAHLIVANNVLAHVPDLHDFVGGFAALLAADGIVTIEFPHVLRTIAGMQFDTIYHEHFSYLSLIALTPLFDRHGLEIVEVAELPTHGGSLRVFVAPRGSRSIEPSVAAALAAERAAGLDRVDTYAAFGARMARIRDDFVTFLHDAKHAGKRVVAFAAAPYPTTRLPACFASWRNVTKSSLIRAMRAPNAAYVSTRSSPAARSAASAAATLGSIEREPRGATKTRSEPPCVGSSATSTISSPWRSKSGVSAISERYEKCSW